jgi:hypothetical protein
MRTSFIFTNCNAGFSLAAAVWSLLTNANIHKGKARKISSPSFMIVLLIAREKHGFLVINSFA